MPSSKHMHGFLTRDGTPPKELLHCDGSEMRRKRIAVIGTGGKAVQLAQELHQWSDDIVACTQGDDSLLESQAQWPRAIHRIRRRSSRALRGDIRQRATSAASSAACVPPWRSTKIR
jgi:cation diffusion facilitator CzcD-associated flavoprotein CzcO